MALAHLDGSNNKDALQNMIMSIQAMTNPKDDQLGKLEMTLIGGYDDEGATSKELTTDILTVINNRWESVCRKFKVFLITIGHLRYTVNNAFRFIFGTYAY